MKLGWLYIDEDGRIEFYKDEDLPDWKPRGSCVRIAYIEVVE